jgi:hypothetical protein
MMPSSDEFAMPRAAGRTRRSITAMAALVGGAAVDPIVDRRTQLDRLRDLAEERAVDAA